MGIITRSANDRKTSAYVNMWTWVCGVVMILNVSGCRPPIGTWHVRTIDERTKKVLREALRMDNGVDIEITHASLVVGQDAFLLVRCKMLRGITESDLLGRFRFEVEKWERPYTPTTWDEVRWWRIEPSKLNSVFKPRDSGWMEIYFVQESSGQYVYILTDGGEDGFLSGFDEIFD